MCTLKTSCVFKIQEFNHKSKHLIRIIYQKQPSEKILFFFANMLQHRYFKYSFIVITSCLTNAFWIPMTQTKKVNTQNLFPHYRGATQNKQSSTNV